MIPILDIDVEGVRQVKTCEATKDGKLSPYFVFIAPPSIDELASRLQDTHVYTEEEREMRVNAAKEAISYAQIPGNFHRLLLNDDLDACLDELVAAVREWYPNIKPKEDKK